MRRLVLISLVFISMAILAFAGAYIGIHRNSIKRPGHIREAAGMARPQAVVLTDLDGKHFRTSDYQDKVVLVNFWAAWCAPCAEEIPQFVAMQSKYRQQGLQVIGISVEDVESELRAFCIKNRVNYPIVPGDQTVADSFGGVLGLPTTILIGKDGTIYKKYSGATDFAALEHDLLPLLAAAR
jgi:peroxiredoxin